MAEGCEIDPGQLLLQLTPREYLETALHSVEGRGASVEAKNRVSIPFSPISDILMRRLSVMLFDGRLAQKMAALQCSRTPAEHLYPACRSGNPSRTCSPIGIASPW